MKRLSKFLVFLALLSSVFPGRVNAVGSVEFPSCLNPQGTVIASYATGTHGIVGDSGTFTGSDAVYRISETQVLQCFCSDSRNGIQTNWLYAGQMTGEELATYTNDGWTYVPNGALWGLSEGAYIAKNLPYACTPNGGGSHGGGAGGGSGDGLSDGRSSCPECTAPPAIGGGDVLGLAATGGMWQIYGLYAISVILLAYGVRKYLTS